MIFALGTVRRFLEKDMDAFEVVVFVVEPIDEVRTLLLHLLQMFLYKTLDLLKVYEMH